MAQTKTLVAYFSATGTTKGVAEELARATGADLAAIEPAVPYTQADLDWNDRGSRSTREMEDAAARVELAEAPGDLSAYGTVLLGFPIWWYTAPRIVDAWVEEANLTGKRVVVWATSGGSSTDRAACELSLLTGQDVDWVNGRTLQGASDARRWAEER